MKPFRRSVFPVGILLFISSLTFSQTVVFSDDFSTDNNSAYTTSGQIGSSALSVSRSGADWGARRNSSPQQLELTNDVGATANANGWVFASVSTSSFSSPYNSVLNANPGTITWSFNMRQIRTDPGGFTSTGNYGVAFILATNTTSPDVGIGKSGYAVVLGEALGVDPVHLVRFTSGLQNLAPIIDSNTVGLTDFGDEHLSVRVTYKPAINEWELFLRNDGAAFADPTVGTLVSQGRVIDSTRTGISLPLMGAYWQGAITANQTAFFDNVRVTVASPTAARVTLGGRVVSASGFGLPGVRVTLSGGNLAEPKSAVTSSFGYYSFEDVEVGQGYVLAVSTRRHRFAPATRFVMLNDQVTNADFAAEPWADIYVRP